MNHQPAAIHSMRCGQIDGMQARKHDACVQKKLRANFIVENHPIPLECIQAFDSLLNDWLINSTTIHHSFNQSINL